MTTYIVKGILKQCKNCTPNVDDGCEEDHREILGTFYSHEEANECQKLARQTGKYCASYYNSEP